MQFSTCFWADLIWSRVQWKLEYKTNKLATSIFLFLTTTTNGANLVLVQWLWLNSLVSRKCLKNTETISCINRTVDNNTKYSIMGIPLKISQRRCNPKNTLTEWMTCYFWNLMLICYCYPVVMMKDLQWNIPDMTTRIPSAFLFRKINYDPTCMSGGSMH